MEILQLTGPEFLGVYLPILLGAAAASAAALYYLRPEGSDWSADDPYDLALLRGGHRGVLEAATARLTHLGALKLDGDGTSASLSKANEPATALHPVERAVVQWADRGDSSISSGEAAAKHGMRGREAQLLEKGVLLDEGTRWMNYLLAMVPLGGAGALGFAKLMIGLDRGRPVGFLFMLLLAVTGALVFFAVKRPRVSRSGQKVLDALKEENQSLRYCGAGGSLSHLDSRDVMLSVALFGMAPLIGTELGPIQRYINPPQTAGGSSCGGSSCGSSCGGGCGGGCGGCGG